MPAKRPQPKDKSNIEWDFYSFPVLFALCFGALIGFLSVLVVPPLFIFVATLFGTSFCTAHVMSHWASNRKNQKQREKTGEDERERRALAARAARAEASAAAAATAEPREPRLPRKRRRRSRS